ncbi:hypothetical protein ACFWY9_23280 [Amycolatopsis sp. NPDC059027]|uniref:hypothetical protein n=1 Tax=Amycolatopsis sp. NPDC059027 TaxID=3346709 RepID=UPI00367109FE
MTEQLMSILGRTEYARKVWWFASVLLVVYSLMGAWAWSQSYSNYIYVTWALTIFSIGLLVTTAREHPFGGWLALVSAPVIGFALMENGVTLLRVYLFAAGTPPNGGSRLGENLGGFVDLSTGVIFFSSFVGFLFWYRYDSRRELRAWTFLNPLLAILALPCIVAVTIMTHWAYLGLRPWFLVVYPAAYIARGPEQLKRLAKLLRV